MKTKNSHLKNNFDEDYRNSTIDLRQQWLKSLPKPSDSELLEIFPEAKKIIPTKIIELEEDKKRLIEIIQKKLSLIKANFIDYYSIVILTAWVRANEGERYIKIDKQIERLKRLISPSKTLVPNTFITEEQIRQALEVRIVDIAARYTRLKRSGSNFIGLCPFHKEKHPSFYIYTKTDSFYCFGCNQGGNTINLVRKLRGCSFKQAINYLLGGY
jgi:hypothetical protein